MNEKRKIRIGFKNVLFITLMWSLILIPQAQAADDYFLYEDWNPNVGYTTGVAGYIDTIGDLDDAFNVVATISYAPVNVNIVNGDVTLGDIPAGSGAWSSDFFNLEVDMTNLQDPNEGIEWTVTYEDEAGNPQTIVGVPEFCQQLT